MKLSIILSLLFLMLFSLIGQGKEKSYTLIEIRTGVVENDVNAKGGEYRIGLIVPTFIGSVNFEFSPAPKEGGEFKKLETRGLDISLTRGLFLSFLATTIDNDRYLNGAIEVGSVNLLIPMFVIDNFAIVMAAKMGGGFRDYAEVDDQNALYGILEYNIGAAGMPTPYIILSAEAYARILAKTSQGAFYEGGGRVGATLPVAGYLKAKAEFESTYSTLLPKDYDKSGSAKAIFVKFDFTF